MENKQNDIDASNGKFSETKKDLNNNSLENLNYLK